MIDQIKTLINQDYTKLTYKDLIEIKKNTSEVVSFINSFKTNNNFSQSADGLLRTLKNMQNITDAAYGILLNPYADIYTKVHRLFVKCKEIKDAITETFILDNVAFYGKTQTFNKTIFLALRNGYGSKDKSVQDLIELLTEGLEAYESYNKLLKNDKKMLAIQLKYLGRPKGDLLFGDKNTVYYLYDINEKTFKEQVYHFHTWQLSTSYSGTCWTADYKEKYKTELIKVLPELYL